MLYENHIFQCMGKIFRVEFQRVPLKFHTKYLTHTYTKYLTHKLKDLDFIEELLSVFETPPSDPDSEDFTYWGLVTWGSFLLTWINFNPSMDM